LLLFSKRSAFFCSFLKKRTKKLLFILISLQSGATVAPRGLAACIQTPPAPRMGDVMAPMLGYRHRTCTVPVQTRDH
jgi:hypothetical protein